jgi:hypothetical protein
MTYWSVQVDFILLLPKNTKKKKKKKKKKSFLSMSLCLRRLMAYYSRTVGCKDGLLERCLITMGQGEGK